MPSPVGHALGGLMIGFLSGTALRSSRTPSSVPAFAASLIGYSDPKVRTALSFPLVCAVVACLPDIDFLWGRHAMETHSLGAAALVGLVVWAITRRPVLAVTCALAWASHILFDWLGSDDSPPLGVMALWPLSSEFYFAQAFVFETISRRYWLRGFWWHNIIAVIKEVILLGPPTVLLCWWRLVRRPG